jgi:hypothetical protein
VYAGSGFAALFLPNDEVRFLTANDPLMRGLARVPPVVIVGVVLLGGWPLARLFAQVLGDPTNVVNYIFVVPAYWLLITCFYNQARWALANAIRDCLFEATDLSDAPKLWVFRSPYVPFVVAGIAVVAQIAYAADELLDGRYAAWAVAAAEHPIALGTTLYYLGFQALTLYALLMVVIKALGLLIVLARVFGPFGPGTPRVLHEDGHWGMGSLARLPVILFLLAAVGIINLYTWRVELIAPTQGLYAAVSWYTMAPILLVGYVLPLHTSIVRAKAELLEWIASPKSVPVPDLGPATGSAIALRRSISFRLRIERAPLWPFSWHTLLAITTSYLAPTIAFLPHAISSFNAMR